MIIFARIIWRSKIETSAIFAVCKVQKNLENVKNIQNVLNVINPRRHESAPIIDNCAKS